MTRSTQKKSVLLHTTGAAALSMASLLTASAASAQAIQATPSVVQGAVSIDSTTPGQDTITVSGLDAVIDWTPDEISGTSLTYLPSGTTAIFEGAPGDTNFAVLNRILAPTDLAPAQFDGAVISRLTDSVGNPTGPGGYVAFYSPTGIIVGGSASFDIGGLLLTTLEPTVGTFSQYVSGTGPLTLSGISNDLSAIQIDGGASITGTAEGSSFAVVAPQVLMSGSANINGSTAYIAAQDVNLSFANGLFDIVIPTGTAVASNALFHDGSTTGPASTGFGDNHVIYGAIQAQTNPVQAIFSGNLGFAPAVSASIQNGEILLSANYHVAGNIIQNDFTQTSTTSNISASLTLENALVTSDVQLQSSHLAEAVAEFGVMDITGDLLVYGYNNAEVLAGLDASYFITGDVQVSSSVVGNSISSVPDILLLNANAGNAFIATVGDGFISITGDVIVSADATPGVDDSSLFTGAANGGVAEIFADTGVIQITGDVLVSSDALPVPTNFAIAQTGIASAGATTIAGADGGFIDITGNLTGTADAYAQDMGSTSGSASDAQGGTLQFHSFGNLGFTNSQIDVDGDTSLSASAYGAVSGGASAEQAIGGVVDILVDDNAGIDITGFFDAYSEIIGGDAVNGSGGAANNGTVQLLMDNGSLLTVGGATTFLVTATGGDGQTGGDSDAGDVNVTLTNTSVAGFGDLILTSESIGGNGAFGAGGEAIGGISQLNADLSATVAMEGSVTFSSTAMGGTGGSSGGSGAANSVIIAIDGAAIDAPNADFNMLSLGVGGDANGVNGLAGDGSAAAVTLDVINAGTADIGGMQANSIATGGTGSLAEGGDALGGAVAFTADGSGSLITIAGLVPARFSADAQGGESNGGSGIGGDAIGGSVVLLADNGATLALPDVVAPLNQQPSVTVFTDGGGSSVDGGAGGSATSGSISIGANAGSIITGGTLFVTNNTTGGGNLSTSSAVDGGDALAMGSTQLFAVNSQIGAEIIGITTAEGGSTDNGQGGDATSHDMTLSVLNSGTLNFRGQSSWRTEAFGGDGTTGGTGTAGNASAIVATGGSLNLLASTDTSLAIQSIALGGDGISQGGDAAAGLASVQINNASVSGAILTAESIAAAGSVGGTSGGGIATANAATFAISAGSSVLLDEISATADALSFTDGTATGGLAAINTQDTGTSLDTLDINLSANADGGFNTTGGTLQLTAFSGSTINAQNLNGSATSSDTDPDATTSEIRADNAQVRILNSATVDVSGNLDIHTGTTGTIIGGIDANNLSATFNITAQDTLSFFGTDDNLTSFGALDLSISSSDINVSFGARFGAPTLHISSLELIDAAVLGGVGETTGYTLEQAEADRIEGDFVTFFGPGATDSTSYDVVLRDLQVFGSQIDGLSTLDIFSDGSMGVVGNVNFTEAGSSDIFTLSAAGRLELVLDSGASIFMDDGGTIPILAGTLNIFGAQIYAADSDGLSTINLDPDASTLAALLADDGGSSVVTHYIGAEAVRIEGDSHILMQNTGGAGTLGGIIVGPGGLIIHQSSDAIAPTMRTIAYGLQDTGSTTVTNDDFFALVDYGTNVVVDFTADATFNNCFIVTGSCAAPPPPPPLHLRRHRRLHHLRRLRRRRRRHRRRRLLRRLRLPSRRQELKFRSPTRPMSRQSIRKRAWN